MVGGLLLLLLLRDGFGVRHHRRLTLEHLGRHVIHLRTPRWLGVERSGPAGRSTSTDLRERRLHRSLDTQHLAKRVLVSMGDLKLVPSLPITGITARVGELAPCEGGVRVSQTQKLQDKKHSHRESGWRERGQSRRACAPAT